MRTPDSKIKSKWWYALPILLGVIGGVIAWFAIKSQDRKLAKNCLILGIGLVVFTILIFVIFLMFSDNFNFVTEFGPISETNDLDFQLKLNTP